ncbi:hypothetical protein [Hymenobacter daeguensis]
MNSLLRKTIEAHGGLERWHRLERLTVKAKFGGGLWGIKGQAEIMAHELAVTVQLHREWTSHRPFGAPDHRTAVTPGRVLIETTAGAVVEELLNPRASFAGHTLYTPWTPPQLAYFIGYGMWNYLTFPFTFALPGCRIAELGPWEENGETWQRMQVTFPDSIATHCPVQTYYVAEDGLIRRHDYDVDINGGTPGAHYFSEHTTVAGITLPTQHRIFIRNADLTHEPEPLIVSIDVRAIEFS